MGKNDISAQIYTCCRSESTCSSESIRNRSLSFCCFGIGNIAGWFDGESGLDKTILLLGEVTEVFGLEQREVLL